MTSRRVTKSVPAVLLATLMAAAGSHAAPTARQRGGDVSLGRLWLGLLQKHATFSGKPPAYPVEAKATDPVSIPS